MTEKQAVEAFRQYVVGVTSLDDGHVINWRSGGMRPDRPYATVRRVSSRQIGRDHLEYQADGDDLNEIRTGERELIAEVQVYGDGAATVIHELQAAYVHEDSKVVARGLSIGIRDIGPAIEASELLETEDENRSVIELTIGYLDTETRAAVPIETIEYTGDVASVTVSGEIEA